MKWQIDYFHWWLLRVIKRKFNYFNSLEFKVAKKKNKFICKSLDLSWKHQSTAVPWNTPSQTSPGAGHRDSVRQPHSHVTCAFVHRARKHLGGVNRLLTRAESWELRNSHRKWNATVRLQESHLRLRKFNHLHLFSFLFLQVFIGKNIFRLTYIRLRQL